MVVAGRGYNMNDVTLIGRIANDLELKEVNNKKMLNINIAINRQGSDKVDFIPCVAFDKTAENVVKYQKKGNLIALKGSIRQNEYTDKEGNKRYSLNVSVNRIKFLEAIKDETNKQATSTTVDDDDMPF